MMTEFYKDQRKVELKVGLIIILSLVILVVGYAWLRNATQIKNMTQLKIRFDNAQGIELGDKVTVNGMEAGRVTKIEQLEDGVLVHCQLKLRYPIREGARFVIQDSNLMGGKQLDILNSTKGNPLELKQVLKGEGSFGMTALLNTASTTMQQINILLLELNRSEGFFNKVEATFTETKNTFGKVNTAIDEGKGNLNNALKHISTSAELLEEMISQNRNQIEKTIQMTPETLKKTQATLDSLRSATASLQKTLENLNASKGTLSKLIRDDKLYNDLLKSNARLDSLLIDIKKNPKRYFKVEVF